MGHYTRWDAVSIEVSDETFGPTGTENDEKQSTLSAWAAEELAEKHDISVEAVKDGADAITDRDK